MIIDGEFVVGNLKLKTPLRITIPEYGHELPEIHSSTPVISPIYASVANIINWLERGIYVEFCNKKLDAERVLFFIFEYNKFAKEENKKINDAYSRYKLALNAEEKLCNILKYTYTAEDNTHEDHNPFKKKIFKGIKKNLNNTYSSSYKNPFSKNKVKPKDKLIDPVDIRAFDIFRPSE